MAKVVRVASEAERGLAMLARQTAAQRVPSRGLLMPPSPPPEQTVKEVLASLLRASSPTSSPEVAGLPPTSQEELPAHRMLDSFATATIPLGSDSSLRDRYLNPWGGVRKGRLLEDMDMFAAHLVFRHTGAHHTGTGAPPASIVTALVDRIHFTGSFRADCDVRMSGHLTWVGSSSAEATLHLHQLEQGVWRKCTEATIVMVARDPRGGGRAFLHPLEMVGEEEEELFRRGEESKIRRFQISEDSLFKVPPTEEELAIIHGLFLRSIDQQRRPPSRSLAPRLWGGGPSPAPSHPGNSATPLLKKAASFEARVRPPGSVWMEEARLDHVIVCQPQNRNIYNKIFGGFIMRQAFELAWANAHVFGQCQPVCVHMDDIWFRSPVEVGDVLRFTSQISYVQENYMQTRVSATVVGPGTATVTNVFHFTFEARDKTPPLVMPKTYSEAMVHLSGRRHFQSCTSRRWRRARL